MMSGAAVSWKSQKQTCVALSTAEAEYIALAAATQKATWMRQLLEEHFVHVAVEYGPLCKVILWL